jgi:hypothetical protein
MRITEVFKQKLNCQRLAAILSRCTTQKEKIQRTYRTELIEVMKFNKTQRQIHQQKSSEVGVY